MEKVTKESLTPVVQSLKDVVSVIKCVLDEVNSVLTTCQTQKGRLEEIAESLPEKVVKTPAVESVTHDVRPDIKICHFDEIEELTIPEKLPVSLVASTRKDPTLPRSGFGLLYKKTKRVVESVLGPQTHVKYGRVEGQDNQLAVSFVSEDTPGAIPLKSGRARFDQKTQATIDKCVSVNGIYTYDSTFYPEHKAIIIDLNTAHITRNYKNKKSANASTEETS